MNTDGGGKAHLDSITEGIIGAAMKVSNTLGCGFLEKVYEHALILKMRNRGLQVAQQVTMQVTYEGIVVGNYIADLLVPKSILVELKVVEAFSTTHFAQCLNYLRATSLPLCLLLNFGKPRLQIKRFVY